MPASPHEGNGRAGFSGSTLYLCGAGNSEGVRLALTVNYRTPQWDRILLLDDDPAKTGRDLCGVKIAGGFDLLAEADPATDRVANLVARTTRGRRGAREKIASFGIPFASMIDADVNAAGVDLKDDDTIVYHHATLGPEVVIDRGSVVFMGAVVGHESSVGPGCVIAANAVINARVVLEEGVYVGSNATILPEITVGEYATIGAGSVVLQDVPAGATVMGVPAQIISAPSKNGADHAASPDNDSAPRRSHSHAELEQAIADIWAAVLEVDSVGFDENFFDLGATSLLALRAHETIVENIGGDLAYTDMFRFTTVRALAQHLDHHIPTGSGGTGWKRAQFRRAVVLGRRGDLEGW